MRVDFGGTGSVEDIVATQLCGFISVLDVLGAEGGRRRTWTIVAGSKSLGSGWKTRQFIVDPKPRR
jgi:hypothetical protein